MENVSIEKIGDSTFGSKDSLTSKLKPKKFSLVSKILIIALFSVVIYGNMIMADETTPGSEAKFQTIFDFTSLASVDDWTEQSDNVREVGMSKAQLTLQKTRVFQRAVFFALLNPQPNGAGFAGVRRMGHLNLTGCRGMEIRCRAQGAFNGFKVVLRHRNMDDEPNVTFEQMFEGPRDEFKVVPLEFDDFKAYYRGKVVNTSEKLDTSFITGFGLQFYGGVYLPVKQSGPATLEMDWIRGVE